MDFSWSASDAELYQRILTFCRQELGKDLGTRERAGTFGRDDWAKCGELGLLGLCLPDEYGGLGLGALQTAHALEAFGRGCSDKGLVFAAAAHLLACARPLYEFAGEGLRKKVLPALATGQRIGAHAITEANAGSDIFALTTRAVREGDDYVLTGAKSYVTNGPVADVFIVYASTAPKHGFMGITGFVLERGQPGLRCGEPIPLVGLSTSPVGSLYLDDCRVSASMRLGGEGQGGLIFTRTMAWERACLFAGSLGAMEEQLEGAVAFANERRQGGHSIGHYQAISHRIADMKLRLDSARLLLYRACWLLDQGQDATLEAALSKIAVTEAAVQSGLDAIQIFGGLGLTREGVVERQLRDALPGTIVSGTSEIQRNLIANLLGLSTRG
jgi:alkylation response protein AidB-like acyl-CoA dehydrogenase